MERLTGVTVVSYRTHAHGIRVTIGMSADLEKHNFSIHLNDLGVAASDGKGFFDTSRSAQQAADELLKVRGHFCIVAGCPDWCQRSPSGRLVH
jgi:hypothetical protein